MPIQVWNCEKCHSQWKDEESAKKCEALHKEPVEYKVLSWVKYDPERRTDSMSRMFPNRIKIKLKLEGVDALGNFDSATYVLERIGPRGL